VTVQKVPPQTETDCKANLCGNKKANI